jgi:hypothetical protein
VQAAVDAASSGDVVRVCPGTYAERVLIPRGKNNLSLRSTAVLGAVLKPPAAGVPWGRDPAAIVVVRGDHAHIRGFRIQGPLNYAVLNQDGNEGDPCHSHTHSSGIAVPEGSATIDSNRITGIVTPCGGGSGVHIGDVDCTFTCREEGETPAQAKVDRNVIDAYANSGVVTEGGSGVVQRNTIMGLGRDGSSSSFAGVDVIEGPLEPSPVVWTVRSNDVSGNRYAGVNMLRGGAPFVVGNRVHGNGTGLRVEFLIEQGELRGNYVFDNGTGIDLGSYEVHLLVRENRVRDSDEDGIHVTGERNRFFDNSSLGNGGLDCFDGSTGGGTAGTANTWARNVGVTDSPDVCRAP